MTDLQAKASSQLLTLPKASLGFFPTPLHRLDRLSEELGVEMYIKRDDLSGRSLFGGNKIRKLEYLLGDAVKKGCDTIFTYGATQSNHAMQTVTACRKCGLTPILYLVALVPVNEADIRANLLLDRVLGAEIHIVDVQDGETEAAAEERSFMLAEEQIRKLEAEGHKCYNVPMGGASPMGSVGFIDGFLELESQMLERKLNADFIFHGTGTGGTLAGLAAGRHICDSASKIISINVSKKDDSYPPMIASLATESLKILGIHETVLPDELCTDLGYYAPGYEQPSEAASAAIRLLAEKEGLLVDPVYTGKAFAGMLDYIHTGKVPQGSTVLFWHTGGAMALFAEQEIVGKITQPHNP